MSNKSVVALVLSPVSDPWLGHRCCLEVERARKVVPSVEGF